MIYYYDISCQDVSIVNLPNYLPGCHSENIGALQGNKKAMLFKFHEKHSILFNGSWSPEYRRQIISFDIP